MRKIPAARRSYYFRDENFPLAVRRVLADKAAAQSHEHDLTEVAHSHDFTELVVVTGGLGVHRLEGVDFPVAAGDVFLLHQEQEHFFHSRDRLELLNVMYDLNGLRLPENLLRTMPGYCALFMLEPAYRRRHRFASRLHLKRMPLAQVEQLISDIETGLAGEEAGREALAISRLLELMVFLSRSYGHSEATEARALLRVGGVIGALEQDSVRAWTVPELMKLAHMSRSNLMRVFRQATGQTPVEYLIRLRLRKAMSLLRQTDWSVTRIASAAGFEDSNYFSRQFRQVLGQSPSSYRRGFPET
jgi:AraC-like DNA-binding protein